MLLSSQELHIDLLLLSSEEIHAIFPPFLSSTGKWKQKKFWYFHTLLVGGKLWTGKFAFPEIIWRKESANIFCYVMDQFSGKANVIWAV